MKYLWRGGRGEGEGGRGGGEVCSDFGTSLTVQGSCPCSGATHRDGGSTIAYLYFTSFFFTKYLIKYQNISQNIKYEIANRILQTNRSG